MCLTFPAQVTRVDGAIAWIDADGEERPVSLAAIETETVRPGDYLLHHAGLALGVVDADEAREILALLAELNADDPSPIGEPR